MKRLILALGLLLLAGCDSGEGTSGGVLKLDCLSVAGDYNAPFRLQGSNTTENMAISIESGCDFATSSPSTGTSYGTLTSLGDNKYSGTGKSPACGGGTFLVYLTGTSYGGITFSAQC